MTYFRPCPSCQRHARADEERCPFCAEALPAAGPPPAMPSRRIGRAALMAFGTLLAVGSAGCDTSPEPEDAGVTMVDAAYGGPPFDAGPPDAFVISVDAAYGGPPFDGGP